MASIFEHAPCSRCGGSGRYSYNHMHGDMCYGCNGKGVQYTKRGIAARQYFNDSLTVTSDELEPGMKLWDKFAGGWVVVESITPDGDRIDIQFTDGSALSDFPSSTHRRAAKDRAELDRKRAEALDYQASLTKAGKPRKRRP